jgi:hypothetical protein
MAALAPPAAEPYRGLLGGIETLLGEARRTSARAVNVLMTATYWEIGRRIVEYEQGGKARAEYGEALLKQLAADLTTRFGRGFGVDNLQRFRVFYLAYPPKLIYATASRISGAGPVAGDMPRILSTRESSPSISATPSRKSLASEERPTPSGKSDAAILQTPSEESTLTQLASRFPLPWSAYVRLLAVKSQHARLFYETEAMRGGWSVRQLDRQIQSQFYERTALSRNKAAMLTKGARPRTGDAVA